MCGRVRRASIITNDDCEFLKVDKPSFDEVLRMSFESEWNKRLKHITNHPLFCQWKDHTINTAVEGLQAKEYLAGSVLLKDLSVPSEKIYLIIQGSCHVVQRVRLWEKVQSEFDNFLNLYSCNAAQQQQQQQQSVPRMAPRSAGTSSRGRGEGSGGSRLASPSMLALKNCKLVGNRVYRLVTKWWIIRTLKEGEYFGLGEGTEDMSVVCSQKVLILHMSKNVFRKHDRARDLAHLRADAISWYPSTEEALASYLEWKRWLQYRRNLVLAVQGHADRGRESTENYMLVE